MTSKILWTTYLAASMISRVDLSIFSRKLPQSKLIFHHFMLEEVIQAYDSFDHDMKVEALKVIVTNEIMMEKSLQEHGRSTIPFPIATYMDAYLDEGVRNPFRLKKDVLSSG